MVWNISNLIFFQNFATERNVGHIMRPSMYNFKTDIKNE